MTRPCSVCGNAYDKPLEIRVGGQTHVFDCFECAISALAPACGRCGCRVIGHGTESDEGIFCSAHCAQAVGVVGVHDRV